MKVKILRNLIFVILILVFGLLGCTIDHTNIDEVSKTQNIEVTFTENVTSTMAPTPTENIANTPASTVLNTETEELDLDLEQFYPDQSTLFNIYLEMSPNEVENIIGLPNSKEEVYAMAFDGNEIYYYYDFGMVGFIPEFYDGIEMHVVDIIRISESGYLGPRNIMVGDTINEATKKMGINKKGTDMERELIYENKNGIGYLEYDIENQISRIDLAYGEYLLEHFFVIFEKGEVVAYGIYVQST